MTSFIVRSVPEWPGLSDAQWDLLRAELPERRPLTKRGRPRESDRKCLEGILWLRWSGASWAQLPERFAHPRTCRRRWQQWRGAGVLGRLFEVFAAAAPEGERERWRALLAASEADAERPALRPVALPAAGSYEVLFFRDQPTAPAS
ncbi:MAG TPA: transposase [Elusimicrobiota bacterium]|nr:transposase [Elusimicrobiota bacterium]